VQLENKKHLRGICMVSQENGNPIVRVGMDGMTAYLILPRQTEENVYTRDEIDHFLIEKGVTTGILEENINKILTEKIFDREMVIAQGKDATDGKDGWYEYKFNREFSRKPEVLPDGSVNYWNMSVLATVMAGQAIAIYHPAIQGVDGFNVKGVVRQGKRAKELGPLKGKGFVRSEDGLTYLSQIDGRIEVLGDKVTISPIYEIFGDADLKVGNIDFRGDVIVHGSVKVGLSIRAGGTLTIDGIVESAVNLFAGKDILLKSGMMGDSRATVTTKGNLFCKFIEYSQVTVGGFIEAEALLSCDVECGDKIVVKGSKGRILGGRVRAVRGIDTNSVGNAREVFTLVAAGIETDIYRRLKLLEQKQLMTEKKIKTIEEAIIEYEKKLATVQANPRENNTTKMNLLRGKIQESATLAKDKLEIEDLTQLVMKSKESRITVFQKIFPGVTVMIDDQAVVVKELQENVYFEKYLEHIAMKRNE